MLQEASVKDTELQRIIHMHFLALPDDCQKVLMLFIQKMPLEEIAGIMGFKTTNYAKTRKFLCKQDLKKRVSDDPRIYKFLKYDKTN